MTEERKLTLNKVSVFLGIFIMVVGFIAYGVRIVDITNQTAAAVKRLALEDDLLNDKIVAEREARAAEYTQIKVKLVEIDTRLLYIQQGVDNFNTR